MTQWLGGRGLPASWPSLVCSRRPSPTLLRLASFAGPEGHYRLVQRSSRNRRVRRCYRCRETQQLPSTEWRCLGGEPPNLRRSPRSCRPSPRRVPIAAGQKGYRARSHGEDLLRLRLRRLTNLGTGAGTRSTDISRQARERLSHADEGVNDQRVIHRASSLPNNFQAPLLASGPDDMAGPKLARQSSRPRTDSGADGNINAANADPGNQSRPSFRGDASRLEQPDRGTQSTRVFPPRCWREASSSRTQPP